MLDSYLNGHMNEPYLSQFFIACNLSKLHTVLALVVAAAVFIIIFTSC